ncbi:hypothetical protein IP84_13955 [beta proteobacterium AAP99]|nr:hypothetical protein IP84_13955 [beta proteobacterium AAP99]
MLWTQRFEEFDVISSVRTALGYRSLSECSPTRLRTSILTWPGDLSANDQGWGHFAWACFLEALTDAIRWQCAVRGFEDPLEQDDPYDPVVQRQRRGFLEQLSLWSPKLSSAIEPVSSSIGAMTWRDASGALCAGLVTFRRTGVMSRD